MTISKVGARACAVILLITVLLGGCSAFKAKRRVDLTPFAQYLIAMSEDIQYGLSEEKAIWLRRYMGEPEVAQLLREYGRVTDRTRRILRAILAYSIEVVTLAQLEADGPEKAQALAGYLEYLKRPAVETADFDVHITPEKFDEILADIRTRKDLIDAINAAQPIADEVARITGEHISQVEVLQVRLEDAITASIEREHASQLKFVETLNTQHSRALEDLTHVLDYIDGDREALALLREADPVLMRNIPKTREPSEEQIVGLIDMLLARLDKIERVRESLKSDLEAYETELGELHRLILSHQEAVRKARATALAWAQAHRKLASGVVDPAKIDMFGITRSVIKGAL